MKAEQSVVGGKDYALPNEELGMLHRKYAEITRQIESGKLDLETALNAMQEFVIEGKFERTFETWVSLKTDNSNSSDLMMQFYASQFKTSTETLKRMIKSPNAVIHPEDQEVELIRTRLRNIGILKKAHFSKIRKQAENCGLVMCSTDTPLRYCIERGADKKLERRTFFGINPIALINDYNVLQDYIAVIDNVDSPEQRWILAAHADQEFYPEEYFVFVRKIK